MLDSKLSSFNNDNNLHFLHSSMAFFRHCGFSRSAVDSSTDNDVIAVPAVLTYGCVQVTSSC